MERAKVYKIMAGEQLSKVLKENQKKIFQEKSVLRNTFELPQI